MIYKFKSKASGDVIMLQPNGDELLRAIGREPAERGIIEPPAMAAAIAAIERAIADDEARRAPAARGAPDDADGAGRDGDDEGARGARRVSLRARLWPMVEMMRAAMAAGVPIVWGV